MNGGQNENPWLTDPADFSDDELLGDTFRFLLRHTILAPSSRSAGPWQFRVQENRRQQAGQGCNLRTQFIRLIKRAGLVPWPKLFQAMRATRETELMKTHPIHVVTAWIGNSVPVAMKHYLQVTDADFEFAGDGQKQKAAQKAAQQLHEMGGNGKKAETPAHEKTPELPGFSSDYGKLPNRRVGVEGLEPPTSSL